MIHITACIIAVMLFAAGIVALLRWQASILAAPKSPARRD